MPEEAQLLPSQSLRAEIQSIIASNPSLQDLLRPQCDEPELPKYELLVTGQSPYYVVKVAIPGRSGTVWASRLPGIRPTFTEEEIAALIEFGIHRVVCLVPTAALENLHGAYRYLQAARGAFPGAFHQVEIVDHEIPGDDVTFERTVEAIDDALGEGEEVLVHCVGGCGRTGMFVSCLMVHAGSDAEKAIRAFRRSRRCGPETLEQLAYVIRFEQRCSESAARRSRHPFRRARVRFALAPSGERQLIAKGGLASIFTGRLQIPGGGTRRVALKVPHAPWGDETAQSLRECILSLRREGVRLPRMAIHKLDDGTWAQVSPLFGSNRCGSKFHQPSLFYENLDDEEKAFAVDQLTRVTNAGYLPSIDLFVAFKDHSKGIVPIDLDLIAPEPDPSKAVRKLIIAILQLGASTRAREALLDVARRVARPSVRETIDALLISNGAFHRAWKNT